MVERIEIAEIGYDTLLIWRNDDILAWCEALNNTEFVKRKPNKESSDDVISIGTSGFLKIRTADKSFLMGFPDGMVMELMFGPDQIFYTFVKDSRHIDEWVSQMNLKYR